LAHNNQINNESETGTLRRVPVRKLFILRGFGVFTSAQAAKDAGTPTRSSRGSGPPENPAIGKVVLIAVVA
jgi:hypothetical protein